MSVGLFCSVFNDIYSKIFIFGAIMTKNEHFQKFLDMIINTSEWF